jgi:hypothetical protein
MFVVSLSRGQSSRHKLAPTETITIKPRRESKEPGLAATCETILIPIFDFRCSRFSEFLSPQAGGGNAIAFDCVRADAFASEAQNATL